MPEIKVTTIRLPLDLWKRLRDLQTEGRIESIQQVAIDAIKRYLDELEGRR